MNLTMMASLISALCAGAVGYGTASHFSDIKIMKMESEAKDVRIAIQRSARATTDRLTAQVTAAQDEAQRRAIALQRDRDSAAGAASGLRDTSTVAVRASHDAPTTCPAIASAYSVVVAESADFIREVAESLDKCESDRAALSQAWPR